MGEPDCDVNSVRSIVLDQANALVPAAPTRLAPRMHGQINEGYTSEELRPGGFISWVVWASQPSVAICSRTGAQRHHLSHLRLIWKIVTSGCLYRDTVPLTDNNTTGPLSRQHNLGQWCWPSSVVSCRTGAFSTPQANGRHDQIVAIAIDEAHCVYKWGAVVCQELCHYCHCNHAVRRFTRQRLDDIRRNSVDAKRVIVVHEYVLRSLSSLFVWARW